MENKEKQKKTQEKYLEMQILDQQMKQVQKQLQLIGQQIQELAITEQALTDIKITKPGTEIFIPLASGIFIKAEIKDTKELALNVGANIVVKKDIENAELLISGQRTEIENIQKDLSLNLQKLNLKAREIEKEITQLIK